MESSYLPLRLESEKAMVQPYSKVTNLPQPNNGPANARQHDDIIDANKYQRYILMSFEFDIVTWCKDGSVHHWETDEYKRVENLSIFAWKKVKSD